MKTTFITIGLLSTLGLYSRPAIGIEGNRPQMLQRIKRACEKNILKPRLVGKRIQFCACIVRNHSSVTKTDELPLIERIYNKSIKLNEATTTDESIIADFDIDLSVKCLEDTTYEAKEVSK